MNIIMTVNSIAKINTLKITIENRILSKMILISNVIQNRPTLYGIISEYNKVGNPGKEIFHINIV